MARLKIYGGVSAAEHGSQPRFVSLIIACAFFMHSLDSTIVGTALPRIAETFHTSPVRLSIAITAYIVSLAVFIPMSGWLTDRYGAKTIFSTAICVFTVASILCGLSNNVGELAATRVLQGAGGAMMIPVGRLVVLRAVPKSEFVKAMMMVLVPAQIGPVMGPVVGGFITTYISWRWVFLINAPIGLIGLVCALLFIRNYKESERKPFDWTGFALSFACLFCILSGLETVGRDVVGLGGTLALLGIGLAFGVLLILHSLRAAHPLIDLSLPRIQTFRVNLSGGTFFRTGFGTASFMLPLMFQVVFGMSAFASGLLTFGTALGSAGSRAMLTNLLKRFGYRNVLLLSSLLYALSVAMYALLVPSTPKWIILLVIFIAGIMRILQNNSFNTLAYADVPAGKMSAATTLAQLSQQLGQVIGIAVSALVLQGLMAWHGETHLSLTDFQTSFLLIAVLTLFSLPEILGLPKNAGEEISGHRAPAKPAS